MSTHEAHCWAGRWAYNNGDPDWQQPCPDAMFVRHEVVITDAPGPIVIVLCDTHYHQLERQGLITEPNPSPERLAAYERRRQR